MITYKKLIIKNEEEVEELDIEDIELLQSFGDIWFRESTLDSAIVFSHRENELKYKAAKLSKTVDWIIREYEGELYLIPLKKDC